MRALCQLKHTIILAEDKIQEHFEHIVRMLIKLYQKEDADIDREIKSIAEVLGLYNQLSVYLPIMVKIISEDEYKTSARLTANTLVSEILDDIQPCLLVYLSLQ